MIYESPDKDDPIRQGDILYPLPMALLDLNELVTLSEEGALEKTSWIHIKDNENIVVNAPIKPIWGIVASQDCDANRAPFISIFAIVTFKEINSSEPKSPKKWVSLITKNSRLNASWFYLPADETIGFKDRMAVNFHIVFQISRENLEQNIQELRKGRLNKIAYQHYRENIAQYFRRYPYDEWYSLTNEEFEKYNEENGGQVEPFEWQK